MNLFITVYLSIISAILLLLIGLVIFIIYRDGMIRKREFDIKLEAAKASANAKVESLSYKELLAIVDQNMKYYVGQAILTSGIVNKKNDEERSLVINEILISTCAQVEMSISVNVKEAILKYVTLNHLQTYIKDATRLMLIAEIENRIIKNNTKVKQ